jgi:hypothetical protein
MSCVYLLPFDQASNSIVAAKGFVICCFAKDRLRIAEAEDGSRVDEYR